MKSDPNSQEEENELGEELESGPKKAPQEISEFPRIYWASLTHRIKLLYVQSTETSQGPRSQFKYKYAKILSTSSIFNV